MTPERALAAAIAAAPAPVRFWWRDDDAGRDDERLVPLLRLAERRAAPVALAVVPDWLDGACRARILDGARRDRAAARHRACRPCGAAGQEDRARRRAPERDRLLSDLRRGRERLLDAFGEPFRAGAGAALEPDRSRPGAVAARRRASPASRPSGRGGASKRPRACARSTRIWTSSSGARAAGR